jgi:hypothetical protein
MFLSSGSLLLLALLALMLTLTLLELLAVYQ